MTWPQFEPDEVEAATGVLQSGKVNYWTGQEGRAFEREFADYVGVRHAIALANGTVALELALWARGIDSGEVVVPSRTFIATASAVTMRGAKPVFADVDRDSGCVTAATIAASLSPATRAVIVVHLGGWPCEMDKIVALCRDRGLMLIEDCAQAHGATYRGRSIGGLGDMAAFSFCQDKILTTAGEGGMLVLNDDDLFRQAWSFKDHGKDWDEVHRTDHPPGFRWLHQRLGTNWRLSEVQSAVGRVQLSKLDRWVEHRRKLGRLYQRYLSDIDGLRVPTPPPHVEPAYYKQYAYVEETRLRPDWSRQRILEELGGKGLRIASGSCSEIYLEKAFPESWRPTARHSVAQELGESSLMFLVDPTIDEDTVERTCSALSDTMKRALA